MSENKLHWDNLLANEQKILDVLPNYTVQGYFELFDYRLTPCAKFSHPDFSLNSIYVKGKLRYQVQITATGYQISTTNFAKALKLLKYHLPAAPVTTDSNHTLFQELRAHCIESSNVGLLSPYIIVSKEIELAGILNKYQTGIITLSYHRQTRGYNATLTDQVQLNIGRLLIQDFSDYYFLSASRAPHTKPDQPIHCLNLAQVCKEHLKLLLVVYDEWHSCRAPYSNGATIDEILKNRAKPLSTYRKLYRELATTNVGLKPLYTWLSKKTSTSIDSRIFPLLFARKDDPLFWLTTSEIFRKTPNLRMVHTQFAAADMDQNGDYRHLVSRLYSLESHPPVLWQQVLSSLLTLHSKIKKSYFLKHPRTSITSILTLAELCHYQSSLSHSTKRRILKFCLQNLVAQPVHLPSLRQLLETAARISTGSFAVHVLKAYKNLPLKPKQFQSLVATALRTSLSSKAPQTNLHILHWLNKVGLPPDVKQRTQLLSYGILTGQVQYCVDSSSLSPDLSISQLANQLLKDPKTKSFQAHKIQKILLFLERSKPANKLLIDPELTTHLELL